MADLTPEEKERIEYLATDAWVVDTGANDDEVTGKNYDHRKVWIEQLFQQFAACFGIDLRGTLPSATGQHCSNNGFLQVSLPDSLIG